MKFEIYRQLDGQTQNINCPLTFAVDKIKIYDWLVSDIPLNICASYCLISQLIIPIIGRKQIIEMMTIVVESVYFVMPRNEILGIKFLSCLSLSLCVCICL